MIFDVLYKLNYTYFFTFVLTPKCQKDGKNQKKLKKISQKGEKKGGKLEKFGKGDIFLCEN